MEIIKNGDPDKIKRIKLKCSRKYTCSHCGCVFTARPGELKPMTEHDSGYATCPECGMKV